MTTVNVKVSKVKDTRNGKIIGVEVDVDGEEFFKACDQSFWKGVRGGHIAPSFNKKFERIVLFDASVDESTDDAGSEKKKKQLVNCCGCGVFLSERQQYSSCPKCGSCNGA